MVSQGLQLRFDLPITLRNLVVIELIEFHSLLQSKQMLRTPVALQGTGDLGLTVVAVARLQPAALRLGASTLLP